MHLYKWILLASLALAHSAMAQDTPWHYDLRRRVCRRAIGRMRVANYRSRRAITKRGDNPWRGRGRTAIAFCSRIPSLGATRP